ncbi:hypothetical protein SeMB42_g02740 [Synchytrium endobioticum]|uniref:U3 small nucleolar RNA-associated protein 25 n=1 Tax=Synchytrium endobioticum TaxID=286115 RepID=A0A507DCS7_9FUNG|nr:hypothetical protein SeLEV6574_g05367 [Synchytrium endobioticum]TPX49105.1 hypothetical protein SeMB42_g02740 [Synchytrium endobioticum]
MALAKKLKRKPASSDDAVRSANGKKPKKADPVKTDSEDDHADEDAPIADNAKNPYDAHFGENIQVLDELIASVQARKYSLSDMELPELHLVIRYIPDTNASLLTASDTWNSLSDFSIKHRLYEPWQKLNSSVVNSNPFSPLQLALYRLFSQYSDLLFTDATYLNRAAYRNMYCLHALNHVCITRDRVLKNNARQATHTDLRDQGFTRPKVLILAPFRNSAYMIIQNLIALAGASQKENMKRFVDEFGPGEEIPERKSKKPDDFIATFEGNVDDCFRIGIKLNRKSVKLFSPLYAADIIVASPLGMRLPYGDDQDDAVDFLSSIEIVIADEVDTFLMQNWDHVVNVFENLNKTPKKPHDCDFSRIKLWYLDDKAKYLRQTLFFSSFVTPEINSLFNSGQNIAGKYRTKHVLNGVAGMVELEIPQVFLRIPLSSVSEADDARFNYFVTSILPSIHRNLQPQTLIMIPSYFDFVRIRNHLSSVSVAFAGLSEYTSKSKVSRERALFFQGHLKVLLYTERIHFFHRYNLKGVQHIVFYSLPDHVEFYHELLNMMEDKGGTVSVLYSKYDVLKLERVVGTRVAQDIMEDPVDKYLLEM